LSLGDENFLLGPEPAWVACEVCGLEQTMRSPCWDCDRAKREQATLATLVEIRAKTIPAKYAWSRLDAPELPGRVSTVRGVKVDSSRILGAGNVVLVGPSGTGKTSLAVACLRERLTRGGEYFSAVALGQASLRHKAGAGEAPLVERACRVPLALIDDVGSEAPTAASALPEVIFRRHEADLATWITTGLKRLELVSRYGEGIARRIVEGAVVVQLGTAKPGEVGGER